MYKDEADVCELLGKTLSKLDHFHDPMEDVLVFTTTNGEIYNMYYDPDWCATCTIEDICGDLEDLVGSPILLSEVVTNKNENPPKVTPPEWQDSYTWTFYKFSTIKGSVTIRWYGESNGYYSESVSFARVDDR